MAIGSFFTGGRARSEPGAVANLNILLLSRSLSTAMELLCAMEGNLGEAAESLGLSLYTREQEAIAAVAAQKTRFERYFWTLGEESWTSPPDEAPERFLTFSLSPAGQQRHAIDLTFCCATPAAESRAAWADAVWLLADGGMLLNPDDPFTVFLRARLAETTEKPALLLLSQIERLGPCGPAPSQRAETAPLYRLARERFEGLGGPMIPLRLYGGMTVESLDERGVPVLRVDHSGYTHTYRPEYCELPALWTLAAIAQARQTDFFTELGGLLPLIRRHCAARYGEANWTPARLEEKEDA